MDHRIRYYTRNEPLKNFGDYLAEYIWRKALVTPLVQASSYYLVGSAIDEAIIRNTVAQADGGLHQPALAFWCCGARSDRPIPEDLLARCAFFGVRGPLTRSLLGLPLSTPTGDPGFLMPLLYTPSTNAERRLDDHTLCIPHCSEAERAEELRQAAGADRVISAWVRSDEELHALIDAIVSADFVLTGSLHGAILACAYRRPFAFWDTGFVDIPFKWADFAASIGVEPGFASDMADGFDWYASRAQKIVRPGVAPILACCPFGVRSSIVLAANSADLRTAQSNGVRDGMDTVVEDAFVESAKALEAIRLSGLRHAARAEAEARLTTAHGELERVLSEMAGLSTRLALRQTVVGARISPENPAIAFGQGQVGAGCLASGWTEPNELGPWSLPPLATLMLPTGLGWEEATSMEIFGYIFAPLVSPHDGRRHFTVHVNGEKLVDRVFINDQAAAGAPFRVVIPLPAQARSYGGDLQITFAFDDVGTNQSLGLGEDTRPIGFAPVRAEFCFGLTTS